MGIVEYIETEVDEGDAEGRVLDAVAEGMPYVMVICTQLNPDITIRCVTGGGILDAATAKGLLGKAYNAFP